MAYFTASVDTPETNKKFAEELGLDYPILSDPGKQVARAYGVVTGDKAYASRWTFYIGRDGKILYIDKKVNPEAHGQRRGRAAEGAGDWAVGRSHDYETACREAISMNSASTIAVAPQTTRPSSAK